MAPPPLLHGWQTLEGLPKCGRVTRGEALCGSARCEPGFLPLGARFHSHHTFEILLLISIPLDFELRSSQLPGAEIPPIRDPPNLRVSHVDSLRNQAPVGALSSVWMCSKGSFPGPGTPPSLLGSWLGRTFRSEGRLQGSWVASSLGGVHHGKFLGPCHMAPSTSLEQLHAIDTGCVGSSGSPQILGPLPLTWPHFPGPLVGLAVVNFHLTFPRASSSMRSAVPGPLGTVGLEVTDFVATSGLWAQSSRDQLFVS